MSILSAIKQQKSSIDDLAALPQAMIMQMAQRKEIREDMLAPILARKAELADAMARQKALQAPVAPTVMEQLMAKNAAVEQPAETGVAQLPVPEREYAGGGIIAFADGGMSDEEDDYEDALEEADYNNMIENAMNSLSSGIRSLPSKISAFAKSLPKSYDAIKAEMSQKTTTGGHKYEDAVLAEAKKQGVDPKLALHVLYKETGGHKSPETAKSHAGAVGPMQLMPKTAKALGVDPTDPMQNIHGGVKYLAQLGKMFDQDPRLTAAAYNAGPGNVRKHGGVPNFKETQNYVVGLAKGGDVKHFANQGYVGFGEETPYDPDAPSLYDTFGNMLGSPLERLKSSIYGVGPTTAKERAAAEKQKKVVPPKMPDELKDKQIAPVQVREPTPIIKAEDLHAAQAEAPKSPFDLYMEKMLAREEGYAKQRADDKNMALLTAGLGILGGSSPYAFENIGKGALAGVQQLGESNKQRAAEQAALDKSMLYAHRYKSADELARANAEFNRGLKTQTLEETRRANTNKELEHAQANLNNYLKVQQDMLKSRFPAGEADPAYQAAMQQIYLSAPYRALAQRAGYTVEQPRPTFTQKQSALLNKYLP